MTTTTQPNMTAPSVTEPSVTDPSVTDPSVTDPSAIQQRPDPRPIHRQAMTQTESIVAAVEPGQLGNPTPCAEYDVRALLSHIVGGLNRVAIAGEGGDALARPARADDVPDDSWLAAYQAAASRAAAAWTDDAKLDALVELPWGKMPGRFAIAGYIQEVLTHGWDLAKATGQPTERDPELAAWALAGARRILPTEPRGADVPFGAVVQVAPDAGPYAQLAAWLGRQP